MTDVPAPASSSLWSTFLPLLPLTAAVFVGFLAMGMALPVLPRHVNGALGQGTLIVGVVMGAQYLSACLLGRAWAGEVADARGPRRAMLAGLLGACVVGAVYLASLAVEAPGRPGASLAVLVGARLVTGVAESFIITGALSWGIARVGPAHAGKVIGWVGMALFGAYAAGAPLGAALWQRFGFAGIAVATLVVPLLAAGIVARIPGIAPGTQRRPPFWRVLGAIRLPGLGLTLCSVGYAVINAFVALLFVQRGWGGAALAFTALGGGFILARVVAGHLPDQLGGARVAAVCVAIEAVGQGLIWLAPGPVWACAGAALTGAGYALAFQGFGVEAVRRAPPQSRGAAMGGYVVFQDIAMGLSAPLGGALAIQAGLGAVYLAGAVAALGSAVLAVGMLRRPHPSAGEAPAGKG